MWSTSGCSPEFMDESCSNKCGDDAEMHVVSKIGDMLILGGCITLRTRNFARARQNTEIHK